MAVDSGTYTPETLARRAKIAEAMLADATRIRPIQHWMEGVGQMGQAALAGYNLHRINEQENEGTKAQAAVIAALMGGGSMPGAAPAAVPASLPPPGGAPPRPPADVPMPTGDGEIPLPRYRPEGMPGGQARPPIQQATEGIISAIDPVEGDIAPRINAAGSRPAAPMPAAGAPPAGMPAAAAAMPPQAPPMAGGQPDIKTKIAALLTDPKTNPHVRRQVMQLAGPLLAQSMKPAEYDFKVVGDKLVRNDPRRGTSEIVPGVSATKPTYGVIGQDEYERPTYGWIDPEARTTTPGQPASRAAGEPVIPPAPPGVNPKQWREEQSKRVIENSLPADSKNVSALRKEVQELPSYKNVAQAMPVYKSMVDAASRDNRAADVNLIYGMAKIMDPGSVVRESEMTIAQAIATLPQALQANIKSQWDGSGRLPPELREAIMQEAASRIQAYRGMFDQDAEMFRGIAERNRMSPDDVLPNFGDIPTFKPTPRAAAPGKAPPVKVTSPAEARKLPKGTPILLPDGTEGVVP